MMCVTLLFLQPTSTPHTCPPIAQTRDRRYCNFFIKKDPLVCGQPEVVRRCTGFWEPFHLGQSCAANSVKKLISGTDPELGFRLAKTKPLLRLVYIHNENRSTTFARKKIYAGFFDVGNRLKKWPDGT